MVQSAWSLHVVQSSDHYLWSSPIHYLWSGQLIGVQSADHYLWSSQLITTCDPVSRLLPVVQSADQCLRRRDRKHCRLHRTGAADSSHPQDSPFHPLHHNVVYFQEGFGAAADEQIGDADATAFMG
jgi:hypothetical protein